ncbi:hypothetical protein HanPI659440_Chr16g0640701 [Helianthus annuus]|nr:hypothetical protein HanPI659440_Chr16g0640701 [Helianthus annuus]
MLCHFSLTPYRDDTYRDNKYSKYDILLINIILFSVSFHSGLISSRLKFLLVSVPLILASGRERGEKVTESSEDYNYVKRNRSFASVTELEAKGIFLKHICNESSEDIKFLSHFCYGELELVRRAVSSNTKAIYLNMIAYEMCAHNPNDFRVSTYIRVMKSLVIHRDDVKELRNYNILLHSLGRDEEVVKMYDEIDVPTVNLYMVNQLRKEIEHHCSSKYKTFRELWGISLLLLNILLLVC